MRRSQRPSSCRRVRWSGSLQLMRRRWRRKGPCRGMAGMHAGGMRCDQAHGMLARWKSIQSEVQGAQLPGQPEHMPRPTYVSRSPVNGHRLPIPGHEVMTHLRGAIPQDACSPVIQLARARLQGVLWAQELCVRQRRVQHSCGNPPFPQLCCSKYRCDVAGAARALGILTIGGSLPTSARGNPLKRPAALPALLQAW